MSNSYHVIPEDGHWIVKKAGAERATRVTETQDEASSRAREIWKNQRAELLIHGKDGKIRQKNSYGNDPYPPKG